MICTSLNAWSNSAQGHWSRGQQAQLWQSRFEEVRGEAIHASYFVRYSSHGTESDNDVSCAIWEHDQLTIVPSKFAQPSRSLCSFGDIDVFRSKRDWGAKGRYEGDNDNCHNNGETVPSLAHESTQAVHLEKRLETPIFIVWRLRRWELRPLVYHVLAGVSGQKAEGIVQASRCNGSEPAGGIGSFCVVDAMQKES